MKIKGTDWKRIDTQKYQNGNYLIHKRKLLCGNYWILYLAGKPLHVAETDIACAEAMQTGRYSLTINRYPFFNYINNWYNYICYNYGFRIVKKNYLTHDKLKLDIIYKNNRYGLYNSENEDIKEIFSCFSLKEFLCRLDQYAERV